MTSSLKVALFAMTLGLSWLTSTAAAAARPNVVLVMLDDFGYECVGANGGTSYRTPNIDRLAAGGARGEHCHVQPLCTPTRAQLMTGKYNVRNYTRFGHLDPAQGTFAQLFKRAGYATCIAGKWQLGRDKSLPAHFGFDQHCLWQLDRRPPRYANPGLEIDGRRVDYSHGEYGPDIVNRYAIDFIASHKDRPFLLYYPMMLTHNPNQPTPDSKDWDPRAMGENVSRSPEHFVDMVAYADKLIGSVVAALDQNGLRENTLVIVIGDNGTTRGTRSRMGEKLVIGGKGSSTHLGTHVPLVASWPGVIPEGLVLGDVVDSTDFLPTICEAAGVQLPADWKLDGRSFLPRLRGQPGNPREWIYCWYARDGGAKAQFEFAMNQRFKLYGDGRMFDLAADLDETHPLDARSLSAEASAANRLLAGALDAYRDARPAALAAQAGPREQRAE
ncbi:MAG: sulfatase-like hydrolase/transferase [Pirellulales bacterium]